MTREEAIRIISGEVLGTTEQTHEAVAMAVEALSAQSQQVTGKLNMEKGETDGQQAEGRYLLDTRADVLSDRRNRKNHKGD